MGEWFYKKVVFAGTFDHLHEGHRHLLRTAFSLGAKVVIGLTTDMMLSFKSMRDLIQSYKERHDLLEEFIGRECDLDRCDIVPIETTSGGAERMEDLEALIVSDELGVIEKAFEINALRAGRGLSRVHIVVVPRIRTKDGRPLSSSRIRRGEEFDIEELLY